MKFRFVIKPSSIPGTVDLIENLIKLESKMHILEMNFGFIALSIVSIYQMTSSQRDEGNKHSLGMAVNDDFIFFFFFFFL